MDRVIKTVHSQAKSVEYAVESCCDRLLSSGASKTGLFTFFVTPSYSQRDLLRVNELLLKRLGTSNLLGQVCRSIGLNRSGLALTAWNVSAFNTFRLDHLGNAKHVSVGKWKELGDQGVESYFKDFESVSLSPLSAEIPKELIDLQARSRAFKNPFIFLMAGKDPQTSLELIDRTFPGTPMAGIVGAMTPFSTGLPTTMYHNEKILKNSVLGIQIDLDSTPKLDYPYLQTFGESAKVTKSRGNIILSLDDSNAAQKLLKSLNAVMDTSITPADQNLYLSFINELNQKATRPVYRITGGDPSKGTLSIDTIKDIENGTTFMMPKKLVAEAESTGISLSVSPEDQKPVATTDESTTILSDTLILSSENGVIVKTGEVEFKRNVLHGSYLCDVPHSCVNVE